MDDALDAIAAALRVAPLTDREQTLLLDASRDVAHGTQRKNAPLSTFLLGVAVGQSADRQTTLDDAIATLMAALPHQPAAPPGPRER